MEITQINEQDLDELSTLYQQLLANDISLELMKSVLRKNKDNANHIVLAAKIKGKLVGTLLANICEMLFGQCKSFMVIEDVVVDLAYRQQGVGRALMEYAEQYAKQPKVVAHYYQEKCAHC